MAFDRGEKTAIRLLRRVNMITHAFSSNEIKHYNEQTQEIDKHFHYIAEIQGSLLRLGKEDRIPCYFSLCDMWGEVWFYITSKSIVDYVLNPVINEEGHQGLSVFHILSAEKWHLVGDTLDDVDAHLRQLADPLHEFYYDQETERQYQNLKSTYIHDHKE